MKKTEGKPLPFGATIQKDKVNFAVPVPEGKEAALLLYRVGEETPCMSWPLEDSVGEVRCLALEGCDPAEYEYNYEIDGEIVPDAYARAYAGKEVWGKETKASDHTLRCKLYDEPYDWEGDKQLHIPYHKVIAYALHVRGFTQDASSKVAHRGTFQGIVEKLPYIKELGVNQIQCMPVYEFEECTESHLNYWGYGKAYYFAPKSAYAADGNGIKGLKDMVKACHKEGIEVVLEMPFSSEVPGQVIGECLRYYMMEYHIDGFILNPMLISIESVSADPILKTTKIMQHREDFQGTMRRFLKGDEGMMEAVTYWLRHLSEEDHIFNYITSHTGFTLKDLVSYDEKHNEENGENNQDGPDYNNSWNCGIEGPTRKKSILSLRKTQMKNAFFLLLLSQGTPCILAGDEFGNSQKGNNNVYCQDNAVSWLNWSQLSKEKELHDFVKVLIALRKEYPLLYPEKEMTGADRTGRGVPDVSYHGEEAWRAPFERTSRQLGVYYSAATREEEECFIAYNMHWIKHDFALPILSKGKNWYLRASTQDGVLTEPSLLKEQKKVELPPRTVMFITGR